jgi:ketosteroid isomerase-like protein
MLQGKKTELVQKLYAAFGRGDVPTILEHLTDDVDWGMDVSLATEIPWYGLGTGKKFVAGFFASLAKECVFTRFEPTEFLESETSVACLVTYECTLQKNGNKLLQNEIHYFKFRGDRIARWRAWEDTAATKAAWNG